MLGALKRVPILPRATYRTISTMSTAAFVKAAEKADPTLAGSNEKDGAAIAGLINESQGWTSDLKTLNTKLTSLTYLHGNSPSSADIALYTQLHPSIASAQPAQHAANPAILRYFLQVQSLPSVEAAQKELPNDFQPVAIDLNTLPKPEKVVIAPVKKEKKDKKAAAPAPEGVIASVQAAAGSVVEAGSAAVAAAGASVAAAVETAKAAVVGTEEGAAAKGGKKDKKEKKEKPSKAQPAKEEPTGPMPSMIEMKVGKVLDVKKHPDAESLYVEQIDVGEAESRTVCSGLVKYMTEDQIRGATIVVICNLKPATMRGVKSMAMLLCATSAEGKESGGIEFVLPPEGSQPGERIYFEGEKYENATPETQLNPKKKIFETIQPGFTTLDTREAAWVNPETKEVHRIRTKDGVCKAASFVGASLS